MLVTISWMKKNYDKYNTLYFNGKLPEIDFKISRSKKTWGYASYRWFRTGIVKPLDITMSNYYDSPEEVKLTTLLHEMIHIYDYTINPHHYVRNGRKVRYDAHGWWFKSECDRLKKFGWDIEKYVTEEEKAVSSLTAHSAALEKAKQDNALLCVIVGTNGFNWMVKTNDSHATEVLKTISRCRWNMTLGSVKDINFYRFDNPELASRRSAGKSIRGWKYSHSGLIKRLEFLKATEVRVKNTRYYVEKLAA